MANAHDIVNILECAVHAVEKLEYQINLPFHIFRLQKNDVFKFFLRDFPELQVIQSAAIKFVQFVKNHHRRDLKQ